MKIEKLLNVAAVQQHRDQLGYGLAFLLWAVIAYVEVEAYGPREAFELVLALQLLSCLVALLAMAADGSFKPSLLLTPQKDRRHLLLAAVETAKLLVTLLALFYTRSLAS